MSRLPHVLGSKLIHGGEVVSLMLQLPFIHRKDLGTHFVRGLVDPGAILRLEGLGQLKNDIRIEPTTFWLVA
jgi:hypothetical protein